MWTSPLCYQTATIFHQKQGANPTYGKILLLAPHFDVAFCYQTATIILSDTLKYRIKPHNETFAIVL
jgi:hypothetical protein